MNVAHVDDVAEGHLLALERGRQDRSYIYGGENMTMSEMLAVLARVTGQPSAQRHFPTVLPPAAGPASQFIEVRLLRRESHVSLEAAYMASTLMTFDDSRARDELRYVLRRAAEALYDSARWFFNNEYVSAKRSSLVGWNPPLPATTS